MKVITPLFLEPLKMELEKHRRSAKGLKTLLVRLGKIKVFDPACGSGNFLIIAYKELRRLEMEVLKALNEVEPQVVSMSGMHLSQFYGIEIDDFACEIARLSLWLAEHQLNNQWQQEFGYAPPALPLRESGKICSGNSLRLDWQNVCPKAVDDEVYVIGNPPFLGTKGRSASQKADMKHVFHEFKALGYLDFVACWFWKGANYIRGARAEMALVATNSICQGEQVDTLWSPIFDLGLNIHIAYSAFPWSNNARDKAAVHVVIVGLSAFADTKVLYLPHQNGWLHKRVANISPYLVEGSNIAVKARKKPLIEGVPTLLFGNKPTDGGNLILDAHDRELLLHQEPKSARWIRKLIGADEFINGKERWCLWLVDATKEQIEDMPLVQKRVDAVRTLRIKAGHPAALKMANKPHIFMQTCQPVTGNYILVPGVSSERRVYVPIGFFSHEVISTNKNFILPDGGLYEFAILNSLMHNDWMRLVSMKLESRYSYGNKIVYNTFPWPSITNSKRDRIIELAQEIVLVREDFPGQTLATLYNPESMPSELLAAHQALDMAIDKLYREKPFEDTADRLSFLLARYEEMFSKQEKQ